MWNKVAEIVNQGQNNIILNLTKVTYMDSAGIGELVACLKRVKEKGGVIKLLNASGKVYDLLQLTKLEDVFESYKDEKDENNAIIDQILNLSDEARNSLITLLRIFP